MAYQISSKVNTTTIGNREKYVNRRRTALSTVLLAGVLVTASATASSAIVWGGVSSNCQYNEQVRMASQTTGNTTHTAGSKVWDKGWKNNAGATTYTGMSATVPWEVKATNLYEPGPAIASAGVRCAPRG